MKNLTKNLRKISINLRIQYKCLFFNICDDNVLGTQLSICIYIKFQNAMKRRASGQNDVKFERNIIEDGRKRMA